MTYEVDGYRTSYMAILTCLMSKLGYDVIIKVVALAFGS